MERFYIYNCLNKKEDNKEIKVIVPGWINIEKYKNNKNLEFLSLNKNKVKTLQTIDGYFNISLGSNSYNYHPLPKDKNERTKITIEMFMKKKEEEVIKILKNKYNIIVTDNMKISEAVNNLFDNNLENQQKIPEYKDKKVNEYELLSSVLNYYLQNCNLDKITKEVSSQEIQYIAKFGDSLFDVHLLEVLKFNKIPVDPIKDFMRSNSNMKSTLIKKGFYELSSNNIDSHFCGSLFEALYWISYKQKNYEVLNSLFNNATGLKLKQEELFYI